MGRAPNWQAAEERPCVVLGAGGMLATALVDSLEDHERHYVALSEKDLDVTQEGQILALLKGLNPQVVINAAGYTDVDGAEKEKERAFAVNGEAPGLLARFCESAGAVLIHFSTDYIFDGSKEGPYLEEDEARPINVYGASKLEGEKRIRETTNGHLIVRTSWLFGPRGRNFVKTILDLGNSRPRLEIVDDQRGSPTYTRHLSDAVMLLVNTGETGTMNMTNAGRCSWYEFAREIFRQSGKEVEVKAISTEDLPRPASRPRNSVLDCTKAIRILGAPLPPWQEALGEYLRELRNRDKQIENRDE